MKQIVQTQTQRSVDTPSTDTVCLFITPISMPSGVIRVIVLPYVKGCESEQYNHTGNLPGAEIEMYSYDHDLEEFVTIGLGTVSKDGSIITSNVGSGVIKAGWHCGSGPGGSGCTHNCADYCDDCNAACNCVLNRSRKARTQTPNDCKTAYCGGDTKPANDPAKDIPKDCKEPICIGTSHATKAQDSDIPDDTTPAGDCQISGCEDGSPTPVDDNGDKPRPEDNPDNFCKTCEDGGIVADASKDEKFLPSNLTHICSYCEGGTAKSAGLTVTGIPDKMCVGDTKIITVDTKPKTAKHTISTNRSLVSTQSLNGQSYTLNGISGSSEQETLSIKVEGCNDLESKVDLYVLPETVVDIPGKSNTVTEYAFLTQTCPNYPNQKTDKDFEIDGCSGPGIQELTSAYIETALLEDFTLFDPLNPVVWGAPDSSVSWHQRGSQTLACNKHDICYQTCASNREACDDQLVRDAITACHTGYPENCPDSLTTWQCDEYMVERRKCETAALLMYDIILRETGAFAWTKRQTQRCLCCQAP